MGLAMDLDDLRFCQAYFRDQQQREPTVTEIRMLDTYWSDHCRHTTFRTELERVQFAEGAFNEPAREAFRHCQQVRAELNGSEPQLLSLMEIAQLGMKELRRQGRLGDLEVSAEDQCLQHPGAGRGRRPSGDLAGDVQERDPQPSHRDRALRRRGHLPGRRHPRPALGPGLRLPGHARDRLRRSARRRCPRPCRANCPSARSPPRPPRVSAPTATRSAWPPARSLKSMTRVTWPNGWKSAR